VHKIHVSMLVNVVPIIWVALHVSAFNHIQDNDVKIVSLIIQLDFSTLFYSGINPCASQPCRNGGTCQPLNTNSYQCICPSGYSGYDCSIRKFLMLRKNEKQEWWISMLLGDPCADNPCLNGASCIPNSSGGFTCQCPPGYSGQRCEDRKNIILVSCCMF